MDQEVTEPLIAFLLEENVQKTPVGPPKGTHVVLCPRSVRTSPVTQGMDLGSSEKEDQGI